MIYKVKRVSTPHPISVSVPGSKSITNRALLIAALANGSSTLKGVLFSDDSRHFIQALIDLGFKVSVDEKNCIVTVEGLGGRIPLKEATVDVGSAGTAARFLTAYLGLSEGHYQMNSSEQMKKRPMKELLESLTSLGASVSYDEEEYHFPFSIGLTDKFESYEAVVDVDKSSQFLSALLISSVLFDKDFRIKVTGSHGMAYVEMTIAMMKQFGVDVASVGSDDIAMDADGNKYTAEYVISGTASYKAMEYDIEPDMSAACYFYAMSPILGVESLVKGVHTGSLQGDMAFLDVLCEMGCSSLEEEAGIKIMPPADSLFKGGTFDLSTFSDQALTLAAIAPFASDIVEIKNVGHIRYQECDRIGAILTNLKAMGIECTEKDGNISIIPYVKAGKNIKDLSFEKSVLIQTYEDHRVAMSFAIPGLILDDIEIENPMCCRKTFENYFGLLEYVLY